MVIRFGVLEENGISVSEPFLGGLQVFVTKVCWGSLDFCPVDLFLEEEGNTLEKSVVIVPLPNALL